MKNLSYILTIAISIFASCSNNSNQNTNKNLQSYLETTKSPVDSKNSHDEMLDKGFELEKNEKIGKLQFGLSFEKVVDLIGEPGKKPEYVVSEADGETYKNVDYTNKGIYLSFEMKEDSTTELASIEIKESCEMKTTKDVGIGSSLEEVKNAYRGLINPEGSGQETLVVGTIYGGLVFNFKNNKVIRVFIGASAE
jgi:hypothetical protein